ncbi:MAG: exosortase/archaeosortase family protein [Phycisphaerales bacterium]|nr:MAG: exosortase/archaeosortase family protein [Phycisphaerales bacterium]
MRQQWRFLDGLMIALFVGLAVYATRSVWIDIFALALRNDESSYIILAAPVALWLGWLRRERIRYCRPSPTALGAIVILAGWALMAIGNEYSIDLFRDTGALVAVVGAVFTVAGKEIFLRFAAAWGALLFLIPVPGRIRHVIATPLQEASAVSTQFMLDLFAVSVERHGNMLVVNGAEVAIAEACNGMRMVAAMALIAYAFVFSFPMRLWARLLLLGLSVPVAILANVVRLAPTSILYGHSTPDIANTFHDVAGWAVLGLALGMMWLVLALLRYLELPLEPFRIREEA